MSAFRQDNVAFASAALLLMAALLFGSGPRGAGDAVVHVAIVPCLALAIWRFEWAKASRWDRGFLVLVGCAMALVVLQLVPLPPGVFASLGLRAEVAQDLVQAGVAPAWRPMTLDVWATVRAGLAVATFGAAWMLGTTLDVLAQRRLLQVALVVGVGLAFFGFAQAAAGEHAVRFHQFHHSIGAIGTFANRNHFAALLAMLLPIALAFAAQAQREGGRTQSAIWFAAALALWLAAALSYSRAGFLLASLALVASVLVLWWPSAGASRRWIAPAFVLGAATLAISHYAWNGLMRRLDQDPLDDLRWQYVHHGLDAMQAWLPWGSGLGTFPWVYAPFEPIADMGRTFAERAHNDPLQVAIEAGLPGLALILVFTFMTGVKAARNFLIWRKQPLADHGVQSVIGVALAVPVLHAWVDYPFRTLAVSVLAGLLLSTRGTKRQASF